MSGLKLPPLSIYAHMPWCVRKCPYCDFNSHVAPENIPQERYVDCLLDDLRHDAEFIQGRAIRSIFFGGGTPSLFAPAAIERFLEGVRRRVRLDDAVEVTLEANPGTIERGRFEGYRAAGVNRISLGAQSFSDHQLKLLGRIHEAHHIADAVDELRAAGFENFNLDLMYGLPEQTLSEALSDLTAAIELAPTHLSHYQLTLEPGTVFYHRPPPLPDDEATWEMQLACQAALDAAGYRHYEVSAYAREGYCCEHNLNYWRFGDYLGLGAGAHGKISDLSTGELLRTERCKQPREYLAQPSAQARLVRSARVPTNEITFEFMLNALRLREPFSVALFESRTGGDVRELIPQLEAARSKGLLADVADGGWQPTELGRRFLNDLQAYFLPSKVLS